MKKGTGIPNRVSAESFVTAMPSNLLVDNVTIIKETIIACMEPRNAKPTVIPTGSFSNEKNKSTIKAMTAEITEGTPNLVKRYPDLPRGVTEKYRDTLSSISSNVIIANAKQSNTGAIIESNKSKIG